MMKENPLVKLGALGQSVWLDFIRRGMLSSGEFQRLIEEDGICGVTSNPAIFEKAISGSTDYDRDIREFALKGQTARQIYQALTVRDIQLAADLLLPVFQRTEGKDGLVSLEVSPHLAHDAPGTIVEARMLWAAVKRPNVLIKVPATREGLPAIEQLLGEGININITLLFARPRYRSVAEAYLNALESRLQQGLPLRQISSVASFFISRIDVLVDSLLETIVQQGGPRAEDAAALRGRVAIAQGKMAYQIYKEMFGGERFRALVAKGARPQRLLWASTSTKNPAYSDVIYVEPLIGPETVNTMPVETVNAYRDHGDPAVRLEEGVDEARYTLDALGKVGISLDQVVDQLEEEGVGKFIKPFDVLMNTLETARRGAIKSQGND